MVSSVCFICYNDFYFILLQTILHKLGVQHNTSAFRRRDICICGFTILISIAAERPKSLKTFLFSASLVVVQLCWLIVVFADILSMVSLASVFERLDAHTSIPLVDCCVMAALPLFLYFVSIETVVPVEPKVLTAVGRDRRSSRWHTLPSLLI